MGFAGDLILKSMDLPYAEEIADRIKMMLPPEIQQSMDNDQEVPPEVQQMMQQAEQAMQQVQQYGQLVQEASAELEGEKSLNEKQKAEIKTELALVRAAKAEFYANVAEELAKITAKDAGITERIASMTVKGCELQQAAGELGEGIDSQMESERTTSLDDSVAKFMQQVDAAMGVIDSKINRKPIGGSIQRDGNKLTANIELSDGSTKSISAVRESGGLKIVPD